jgi:hypothetical protein
MACNVGAALALLEPPHRVHSQVLATQADLCGAVVTDRSLRADGCYALRLWKNGKCEVVLVDDKFPVYDRTPRGGMYDRVFAGPKEAAGDTAGRTAVWMMLLEKAVAKLYGSYGALEGAFGGGCDRVRRAGHDSRGPLLS